jgi:hypothetical protein
LQQQRAVTKSVRQPQPVEGLGSLAHVRVLNFPTCKPVDNRFDRKIRSLRATWKNAAIRGCPARTTADRESRALSSLKRTEKLYAIFRLLSLRPPYEPPCVPAAERGRAGSNNAPRPRRLFRKKRLNESVSEKSRRL